MSDLIRRVVAVSRWNRPLVAVTLLALSVVSSASCGLWNGRVIVEANDNRVPAGKLRRDTLRLRLVLTTADWFPGAPDGEFETVAAFAEEGKAPQIPAPLIRVATGTVVMVALRNALPDSSIRVTGLGAALSATDSGVAIAPGGRADVQFVAGAPGTYLYRAILGVHALDRERETTGGAFVVDPPGEVQSDRIFVMNIWGDPIDSVNYREALAINGRSFPYTERITETLGDSVRWRWVNATFRGHPMHLHGFYFRVDAEGNGIVDTTFAPEARRLVVTESMRAFSTMQVVWQPDRIGNWLFHCHIGFHVSPDAQLGGAPPESHMSGDFEKHMAGLVTALIVKPPPGWTAGTATAGRRVSLYAQEGKPRGHSPRALGYVVRDEGAPVPAADSIEIPGRVLVLTRGVPTDVTIHNRMPEPTVVHWHGLELESYSDGMAGWSGAGDHVAPPVMPADSFVAQLLLPRAGTFMYHTHLNDAEQLTAGLYGAIVVLEPGQTFDRTRDHVFVLGWDGDEGDRVLMNGDSLPAPAVYRAGIEHRIRLVNIGAAGRARVSLRRDTTLVEWRAAAFDGAELVGSQRSLQPATLRLDVGQTADFLFLPPRPGTYVLSVAAPLGTQVVEQRIIVR